MSSLTPEQKIDNYIKMHGHPPSAAQIAKLKAQGKRKPRPIRTM